MTHALAAVGAVAVAGALIPLAYLFVAALARAAFRWGDQEDPEVWL